MVSCLLITVARNLKPRRIQVEFLSLSPRLVCFAPIDLKDATVRLKDGFGNLYNGTTYVPTVDAAGAEIGDSVVPITPGTFGPTVPVGAHCRFASDLTKYEVTARTLSAGVDEVQSMSANGAASGTFTLAFTLPGNSAVVTTAIDFDATEAEMQTIVDAACAALEVGGIPYTANDIVVDNASTAAAAATGFTFSGNSVKDRSIVPIVADITSLVTPAGGVISQTTSGEEVGSTLSISVYPLLVAAVVSTDVITFLPIELEIKIGEGNMTYDESREVVFIRDRGALDTLKEGDEQPMDVSFDFTWEFIRAISGGTTPTIEEVLKHIGAATTWISSNVTDPCAPYVVDVEIVNAPECGIILAEVIRLPIFFYTKLSHDAGAAQVSCTGQCNATMAIITRTNLY